MSHKNAPQPKTELSLFFLPSLYEIVLFHKKYEIDGEVRKENLLKVKLIYFLIQP